MPEKKETKTKLPQSKSKSHATPGKKTTGSIENKSAIQSLPVVGLGASAGGFEALKEFFAKVQPTSGMAFIVLVHMTPNQPSLMPALLQKITSIPVSAAKDEESLEPNKVYVIPPNKDVSVYSGKIQLLDMTTKRGLLPIDFFFRSLAQDQGSNAAAIVLSGMGTDGTLGIKEIKVNDGLVFVQSEESAKYDGMPRSAINTGIVDMIMARRTCLKNSSNIFHTQPGKSRKSRLSLLLRRRAGYIKFMPFFDHRSVMIFHLISAIQFSGASAAG